jgi:large subunit ribosomal protein L10
MKKEEKNQFIETLTQQLNEVSNLYLADVSTLNADATSRLRRLCFKKNIQLQVVKNTLLKKAMEGADKDFSPLYGVLKDNTSLMFCENATDPAKLIKEFRKKSDRPLLKGAYVMDMHFIGDHELDTLVAIKSKEELLGELISLLQSPAKNVISGLQSGGGKLAGILKTLSEKEA